VAAWIPSLALAAHLVPARQIENRDGRGRLSTGVATLDALVGGGWPRAAMSELAGGRSTGRTALLLTSIAEGLRRGETVGLVDVGGALDVAAAGRAGVPLGRLLWIRCGVEKALAAGEIVLGAGGFGLLALDLGEERPRAPAAAWQRLKRAAEQQGAAVLLSSARRQPGALGACAVTLRNARPRFEGGHAGPPPLLLGLEASAQVERGADAGERQLTFSYE
jgi:protein ImuA